MSVVEPQTTARVLMVRPACFGANAETAATNAFQRESALESGEIARRARAEFDALVAALRARDVEVHVVEDTPEPPKPDALFPNNWISFHADGRVVLYPLLAPSRQREVRVDVLATLGGAPRTVLDLRPRAAREGILEGTGSLVLDRAQRVAYACLSPRTAPELLATFCRELGYEPLAFRATDARGVELYHTNVMLSVGTRVAVVCFEAIREARERAAVEQRLAASGREFVALDLAQLDEFAGNLLELRSRAGQALFVLSARARRALRPEQRAVLERHGELVSAELETIETHGGGSARCMIAEIF